MFVAPWEPTRSGLQRYPATSRTTFENLEMPRIFSSRPETYRRDGFGVNPAFFGLVAETNAEIVGYLLYHFGYDVDLAARTLHIVDLYVSEESRRQGVGKSLMAFVQRVCRDVGAKEMLWSVYKSNQPAHEFYARLGGEMIDDQDFMYLVVEP